MLHVTNLTSEVGNITHNVLVLHGQHDPVIPVETAKILAASLPNARLEILEDNGHSCNVENPELFVNKVNSFLFHRP
jgi:pimeloyl-ACP methyl ester carboxylesterase